jgi:hypothetical protein
MAVCFLKVLVLRWFSERASFINHSHELLMRATQDAATNTEKH